MESESRIIFGPFCLDLVNECLLRDSQTIKLRPKAFALLRYLLAHPGKLVTKEELLEAVWPETYVGEAILKVTVRQLREALDDDPRSPRFIETAHRRGYRFIGRIEQAQQTSPAAHEIDIDKPIAGLSNSGLNLSQEVVGRDEAKRQMAGWLDKAAGGERQIVFVTGEAGIGKTVLVDAFARSISSNRNIRISRGQCLEQYGTGEAYLPVLEAIGRLCRDHPQVVDVLRANAPMWLLQMPSSISSSDREALNRQVFGATRERMLREMGEALEVLAADQPLVLILEDLHWSDYSTLDLISYLARQRQPAQLMLIGTYRTAELILSGHPLKAVKQELLAKQQCDELHLDYLNADSIMRYLGVRFPGNRFPTGLADLIHARTGGNPLFMVNAVDYLVAEGLITKQKERWDLVVEIDNVELGVPDSIRQMIDKQVDHLDEDHQRILEAASVAGAEFSTLAVASELDQDRAALEARCDELARHGQFIQDCGLHELPNGEVAGRFGFIHALYQNVLYERVPASRRVQLHRRLGERGVELYGDRAVEIAAELAMHFERGSDHKQAVKYLQQAAENDIRRFAYREAVALARRGLELLSKLPDTPERSRQELSLQLTLGVPLVATQGYAAPDVGTVYLRARELCRQLGETPDVSEVLWGLWTFYTLRAELRTARDIAREFLTLAERLPYPGLAMRGHWAMEITFMHMGEFALALEHFEKAFSLYDLGRHLDDAVFYAQNQGVAMRCFVAWTLWFLGQIDQALERMQEALTLARELSEPHGLAHALFFAAILHQLRREPSLAREHAEAVLAVSREHELVLYEAMGMLIRGWSMIGEAATESAIEEMRRGLAAHRATGAQVLCPHFLALLAEVLAKTRQPEEALKVLEEAIEIAHRNREGTYLAELYRIKAEMLLTQSTSQSLSQAATGLPPASLPDPSTLAEAEHCLNDSIKLAQNQNAKSWELRAAMSIARLYQNRGDAEKARSSLARIYASFTEGFDTADLREAKALLEELS